MSEKSRNFKPDVIRWQFSRMWNCRWNFAQKSGLICHLWYYIRRFITPICTIFSKLETFIIITITVVKQGYMGRNITRPLERLNGPLCFMSIFAWFDISHGTPCIGHRGDITSCAWRRVRVCYFRWSTTDRSKHGLQIRSCRCLRFAGISE